MALALIDLKWLQLPERDWTFIWSAGLLSIPEFSQEVLSWADDLS